MIRRRLRSMIPVRMYLMQMGEIPLLTRDQEITAARKIEATRTRFRHHMLATDFVLTSGRECSWRKVRDGELRLDRTVEVSVTNTAEKKRIMKRIPPNVKDTAADAGREPEGLPDCRQCSSSRWQNVMKHGKGWSSDAIALFV